MKFKFNVKGLENVDAILNEIAPKNAKNLMRATIHGYVGRIAKQAKNNVRVDSGTLKKSIKAKREKSSPFNPKSSLFITTGRSAKNDAFYWRFVEYGTSGPTAQPPRPFIWPAIQQMESQKEKIMSEEFGKKLEKSIKRELKKAKK